MEAAKMGILVVFLILRGEGVWSFNTGYDASSSVFIDALYQVEEFLFYTNN